MRARASLLASLALVGACGGRAIEVGELAEREPETRECAAPLEYAECSDDGPLAAVGLGCSEDPSEAVVVDEGSLAAADPNSWRAAAYFGSRRWSPREPGDERVLILTTGRLPPLGPDAGVMAASGSQMSEGPNLNADGVGVPEPIAEGLPASSLWFDQLSLAATLEVPAGTHSLVMQLAWFSAEFPEFVGSPFGDPLVVWLTSEAFTGNLALVDGNLLTASSMAAAGWLAHVGDDPALAGTGFEGHAGSGWLRLRAPVSAGEQVELLVVLADLGDAEVATAVVLDDLRWSCDTCRFDAQGDDRCGLSVPGRG